MDGMNEDRRLVIDVPSRDVAEGSPFLVFRLSWVAYVREVFAFVMRVLVCGIFAALVALALDHFAHLSTQEWLPILGLLVAIGWTTYSVAWTNSVRLFTDESGVWMQSGVFPWEKGVRGVQWRDVGQAGFTQGFVSWALRSYEVRVSHRFTASEELHLRHVRFGHLAVMHVNGIMEELQGRMMRG